MKLDTLPSQTAYPAGFETSTPDWPQFACWSCKCDRGSEANGYVKITIYDVTWKSYSFLNINDLYPSDPKWPHIDIWPHNIDRGSQADAHVWVLWSCYTTWMSYSIFSENDLLTPVTPNDPILQFEPITKVDGLKLTHIFESYGHAI